MTVRIPRAGGDLQSHADQDLEKKSYRSVRDWDAFVAIYEELRDAARRRMKNTGDQLSLGATGLVHEVFLRLEADSKFDPKADRSVMFASSLRVMREILIDRFRARHSLKRGGGMSRVMLLDDLAHFQDFDFDMLEVHKALIDLEKIDPRQGAIVTMRYFLRMTNGEVAALLEISESLVEKELRMARAWLRGELKGFEPEPGIRFGKNRRVNGRKRKDDESPMGRDSSSVRTPD